MSEDISDSELLAGFRNAESRNYSFNLLIRKYQKKVYWHVRGLVISHYDANDVTQDTFIKVWKHLDSFKEEARLFTWIYRIATNKVKYYDDMKYEDMSAVLGTSTGALKASYHHAVKK